MFEEKSGRRLSLNPNERGCMKRKAVVKLEQRQGSISTLLQSKQTASNKSYQKLFDVVRPYEEQIHKLWGEHGQQIGAFTRIRFDLGHLSSLSMKAVRAAKYPGGYKAYHTARDIPVPRATGVRYAALYQDVASLDLKYDVLTAPLATPTTPITHVTHIT